MSPTYLAWALPLLGDPSTVDLASGAEVMVRSGAIAVVANEAPVPAVENSLTTMAGIRVSSERSTLVLRYRPRTYYQIPNIADARRPLYLHQADGTYSSLVSPRLNLSWTGNATVGDVSYASLSSTFEEGTTAAAAARLPILFLSTSASARYATGVRNSVTVGSTVGYRSVLNTLLDKEDVQIPSTLNVGMNVADSMTLTRKDQLGVVVGATYSLAESNQPQQPQQPQQQQQRQLPGDTVFGTALANWTHLHSQRSNSTLTGGFGASRYVESGPTSMFPVVSAAHMNRFRWWGDDFSSSLAGGVRGFVDPLFATIRPQVFVTWGLTGQHGRSFSTQTRASAFTALTDLPVEPAQYETSGSFSLSGIYALMPGIRLRGGVAWQVRASHLSEVNALQPQSQPTAFIALRGTLGTDQNQGNWL